MSRVIRAALFQADWTGDKESMIAKHEEPRVHDAGRGRAGDVLPGAVLRPVLLPGAGRRSTTSYTEAIPDGPRRSACVPGPGAGHGAGRAHVRGRAGGPLLQHRGGHRRRRHLPRQVPQAAHPPRQGLLGEVLLPARRRRLPGVRHRGRQGRACTSATTATSPRAGGPWGSTAPRSCSTPRPPAGACRPTSGSWSSRRPRWPTSTTSAPSTGSASSRSATTTSTASSYFVDPEGKFVGDVGDDHKPGAARARPRHGPHQGGAGPLGRSTATAGPTPTTTSPRPDRRWPARSSPTARSSPRPARSPPTCSSTARPSPPCSQPGQASTLGVTADRTIDATGKYVDPRRRRRPHPHGAALRRHHRVRHLRDRLAGGGVGRHHHHHRLRRAARRRERPGRLWPSGTRKAEGNCAIDYAFHQIIGGVDDEALKDMRLPRRPRGHHQLQAVHGLPRRVLQRRRPDPAGHADGGRQRRHGDDARRERHRHRRAGRPGARSGRDRPRFHAITRPVEMEEEATHRAIMLAKVANVPALHRAHVGPGGGGGGGGGPRPRGQRVRRDVPAVPVLHLEEHMAQARLRGGQVRVLHADAPALGGPPGRRCGRFLRTNDLSVVATDHCPFCFKEQKELGVGDFSKIPNGIGGVEHRMDPSTRASSTARSPSPAGSSCARPRRPACSASTPARASSPPGPTPTS